MQSVELREARSEDAESCGRIIFEAFGTLAAGHRVST
jgi:hypothetical protein